ncbi:hypothetical protein SUGI_0145280 [Cryptomeria japonica]|uniref:VQ motif-containing protein 8, chloroplastic n=1 Tax=Cryptomeria japonica TaxID=3369 RepID=UPI002408F17E|nr:VQ motif-containing protein 8, chloroplastic [Cryptomeria japonica]GLJ11170.1 hypothetical protein SUGI_0145280 [Cryptomeria japonica]
MDPEQRARGKKELQLHGPRPAPLKISKDSHKIRKPAVPIPNRSQPVIIYTESPKIIHIEAHNFMTLVQRLTGSSSSSESPDLHHDDKREDLEEKIAEESSSADQGSRSENFDMNEKQEETANMENKADYKTLKLQPPPVFSPLSPNFFLPSPQLLSPNIFRDLPLFTPNFDNFFYSPGHFYRFSEPFTPPQRTPPASIISPSPTANTHPQC